MTNRNDLIHTWSADCGVLLFCIHYYQVLLWTCLPVTNPPDSPQYTTIRCYCGPVCQLPINQILLSLSQEMATNCHVGSAHPDATFMVIVGSCIRKFEIFLILYLVMSTNKDKNNQNILRKNNLLLSYFIEKRSLK